MTMWSSSKDKMVAVPPISWFRLFRGPWLVLKKDDCFGVHLIPCSHKHFSLQKQVVCFNHRVVTMVADKLKGQWLWEGCFGWLKTYLIRQPNRQLPSSSYNHNTLTKLRTSVKDSLQMHFKVAVIKILWGFSVYCSCKMNWEAALFSCLNAITL